MAESRKIHPERIHWRNDRPVAGGRYVLYWMQQSQRAEWNHALEYAVQRANARGEPVVVGFGLTDAYPEANLRHYAFLLDGLAETARAVERRGARFVVRGGDPADVALVLAREASLVVCDRGYLRHQRAWRDRVAREAGRAVIEVESDVVVPVASASGKQEWAARTIRPRIHARLDEFLVGLRPTPIERDGRGLEIPGGEELDLTDVDRILACLDVDRTVGAVRDAFPGGASHARARLGRLLEDLGGYADGRGDPSRPAGSRLSPYLHFGQISPVAVALAVREAAAAARGPRAGTIRASADAFLEQLVVRRELAVNFVWHRRSAYDAYSSVPQWARATLEAHANDPREAVYSRSRLEAGRTEDARWNAAMAGMRETGWLPNRLRMYWGKRILAWTRSPRHAYRVARDLNDRWFLDGRDPSSYANIGWLFGLHDRPWPERRVFGTVRTMTAAGLERRRKSGT
jgi:deoxyribodipyrimidine photo-lyase